MTTTTRAITKTTKNRTRGSRVSGQCAQDHFTKDDPKLDHGDHEDKDEEGRNEGKDGERKKEGTERNPEGERTRRQLIRKMKKGRKEKK